MTILATSKKQASSVCSANQCGFGWSIVDIPGRAGTSWLIHFIPTPLPLYLWLDFPKYLSKICPSLSLSQITFLCIFFVITLGFITLNNFAKLCPFTAHSLFQIADEYVPVGLHGDFLPARKLTINSYSPYCKLFLYQVAVRSGRLLYIVAPCKKIIPSNL